jgi:hypothetical protein
MKLIRLVFVSLFITFSSLAEEGMLIPSVIQAFESDMKAMGMKLSSKDIYDVNNASLKDAVLHFNGGCTAELVSSKGLLLTNHHCGFSQIQSHSSLENDYLKYGFWAKSLKEELESKSLYAARMVRIEDVTDAMLFGIDENTKAEERNSILKNNLATLTEEAVKGTHYKAEIKPFNQGNDYYLIVKEIFTDVRLVGAPPSSIGKFGGDTDNWVWPRHTGDFSVFRVYAGADNKPADYNESNKPYEPLHYLPISMKNRKQGEFTMVYGFPGTTEQHLTSAHLKYIIEKERPARISMREKSLSIIDVNMRSSDAVRIQYASKQARIANAYKKWIGQLGGLKELGAVEVKLQQELEYKKRANSNKEWTQKYGTVIDDLNNLVEEFKAADFSYNMAIEYIYVGSEIFTQARRMEAFLDAYDGYVEAGTLDEKVETLKQSLKGFFKNYDQATDKEIFKLQTEEYQRQMAGENLPKSMITSNAEQLTKIIFEKSILSSSIKMMDFTDKVNKRSIKKLTNDPAIMLWKDILNVLRSKTIPEVREFNAKLDDLLRVYIAGKYEMFPDAKHWADANGTMRITYGKLEGSSPVDGMAYTEHTTTDGILAKHSTGNPDFELLPDMVDKYKKRDFGPYAQDGELWVCFTGSNHTTGGNSGSPVIDGEGNLMGLNFDRSWESTMSDYMFDASRCRNIVVDIKYVLWVMDKYAGASHLVEEMDLKK